MPAHCEYGGQVLEVTRIELVSYNVSKAASTQLVRYDFSFTTPYILSESDNHLDIIRRLWVFVDSSSIVSLIPIWHPSDYQEIIRGWPGLSSHGKRCISST